MHHFYFPRVDSCNILPVNLPIRFGVKTRKIAMKQLVVVLQLSAEGNPCIEDEFYALQRSSVYSAGLRGSESQHYFSDY
jgi:hypothetical protein